MYKWLNGYITVEASLIVPIVLLIYMFVIKGGLYAYNRCIISQNNYLLTYREAYFTQEGENYGEVIYGNMKENNPMKCIRNVRRQVSGS